MFFVAVGNIIAGVIASNKFASASQQVGSLCTHFKNDDEI
jgi:hypothetical protein